MVLRIAIIIIVIAVCLVEAGQGLGAQTNSLYIRATEEHAAKSGSAVGSAGGAGLVDSTGYKQRNRSLGQQSGPSALMASWITVEEPAPKDFRVNDLITVVVHEISKHSTTADTETERETSIDLKLEEWFRFTGGAVRASDKKHGTPKLKGSISRQFDGKGDIERQDSLSAEIQAKIIDIMPNGNLLLEAAHSITTDDEKTKITLTGTCRPKDVTADNSIISSKLADLDIKKMHTGVARDATKRGVLSTILDFLNPF